MKWLCCVAAGHYTAYCLNHVNEQWYEYDDQYVTEVDVSQVINSEAYVLFYRCELNFSLAKQLFSLK